MHILTGHSYHVKERKGIEHYRGSVNLKLMDVANALFDFIFYGVLERYPKPSEDVIRHQLDGNLCRCTGYHNIVKAIEWAADKMAAAK